MFDLVFFMQGFTYGGFRFEKRIDIGIQKTSFRKCRRNLDFVTSAAAAANGGGSGSSVGFDVPFPSDYTELLEQVSLLLLC